MAKKSPISQDKRRRSKKRASASRSEQTPSSAASAIRFTHVDRVVYPEKDYTKGDVLAFYLAIAPRLLPHLRDRPITVERFPTGVGERAEHFWQKNTPAYYPSWIRRYRVHESDKDVNYVLIDDVQSLMYVVNQNALTFHIWMSHIDEPDRPDFVLFDIDPHQSTFANAVTVAKQLHEILDDHGVENFLKTSGKSGLHVLTPWHQGDYDAVREWSLPIAQEVVRALPKIATTERMINKRGQRVYVDVMQNARGKHVVPPYVLRGNAGGGVSTPIEWKELTARFNPAKFDLKSALKRILNQKSDPLAVLLAPAESRSPLPRRARPR